MSKAIWQPNQPELTAMWKFMQYVSQKEQLDIKDYATLHQWSIENIAAFWSALCDFFHLPFNAEAKEILSHDKDFLNTKWFSNANLNYASHLLSRDDDSISIISIDERGTRETLTYHQLRLKVAEFAQGLIEAEVKPNDRVYAVMPNVAYTVIAMLATASIGAIWSSSSPDFGTNAILDRLGQTEPKVVFICDGYTYNGKPYDSLDKIQQLSKLDSIKKIVIYPYLNSNKEHFKIPKTIALNDFIRPNAQLTFTKFPFSHPLCILFSSGTTGKPKGIIHSAGGTLLQHIKELGLHTNITSKDNLYFYTTCGWMMWNWTVSALALGATITLYEGSPTYPNFGRQFDLIDAEKVSVFGTSAKFLASVEKEGFLPRNNYTLQTLRAILSTGSPLLPAQYDFVTQYIKEDVQLCSISGGTDIISCFALGNPILPVYPGELQCLGLGMAVEIYDDAGKSISHGVGELVCTKPFPSMPIGFWHDADKSMYKNAYFARFKDVWMHGDFAEITVHGGLIIHGRSDATLNPGGVRIGTAEIYRLIETIPEIVDSVVIGQPFDGDVRIVLFVKLKNNLTLTENLQQEIRSLIKKQASPRHVPSKILQVSDIPRTINGKVVEIAVRQVVSGLPIKNLDSLANPESLAYFKNRVELSG